MHRILPSRDETAKQRLRAFEESAQDRLAEMERLGDDAEQYADDSRAELERMRSLYVQPTAIRGFSKTRRERLWRMPAWLWVPLVAAMLLLLGIALLAATRA